MKIISKFEKISKKKQYFKPVFLNFMNKVVNCWFNYCFISSWLFRSRRTCWKTTKIRFSTQKNNILKISITKNIFFSIAKMLSKLTKVAEEYNVAVFLTNQVFKNNLSIQNIFKNILLHIGCFWSRCWNVICFRSKSKK